MRFVVQIGAALLLIALLWMFPPGCGPAHIGQE